MQHIATRTGIERPHQTMVTRRVPILMRALLALAGVMLVLASPQAQGGAGRPRVILVSIDGFAAFHLADSTLDMPNVRALAAAGAQGPSETVFPSMTHPAHTTLITGTTPDHHGVVDNRVMDRRTGQRLHITNLPRRDSIRVPTIFDRLHARGLRTAAFFWPETRDDASIDDNFTEVFDAEGAADPTAIAPSLLAELRGADVPIDSFFALYDDPFTQGAADVALTRAAIHVLKTRQPAFLALHLLAADKAQHEFGTEHDVSRAALSTADYCIGLLRKAVEEAGLAASTTFVIAADHGFTTVRQELNLAPLLKTAALNGVRWQADGWYVWGELLPSFDRDRDLPALERALDAVRKTPGIARIVRPGEFGALGYPEYERNHFVPGQYLIAGAIDTHLVLDAASTDSTRRPRARAYHGHGYFPDAEAMRPALVISGRGIAPGSTLRGIRNIDIAPTIGALLGVELPGASGRVWRDVIRLPIP